MKRKGRIGSSFDDFLKEEGLCEEVTAKAIRWVIARQLGATMRENHLSKSMLARRMRTSRAQLDRLLDPTTNRCVCPGCHRLEVRRASDLAIPSRQSSRMFSPLMIADHLAVSLRIKSAVSLRPRKIGK